MACKSIDISSDPDLVKYVSREVDTWSSLSDQECYIAKYSGDCAFSKQTMTVKLYMDFYAGGDLQKAIDTVYSNNETVHCISALTWALQIAKGVLVCHERGIIHRDLKPPNGA
jgi:serine/threonine protein kinase